MENQLSLESINKINPIYKAVIEAEIKNAFKIWCTKKFKAFQMQFFQLFFESA